MSQLRDVAVVVRLSQAGQRRQVSKRNNLVTSDKIDQAVSAELRNRRIILGITQVQLAGQVGVTYQQIHKYENGQNRLSASKLYELAKALQVKIDDLFQGLGDRSNPSPKVMDARLASLMHEFANIPTQKHREAVCQLARDLAEGEP